MFVKAFCFTTISEEGAALSAGKDLSIVVLLDFYGELLTEKQRNVIELYYDEDLSLGEIAEHENITRQGVRDSIKRGEQTMLDMEEKLGLMKRFSRYNETLDRISEAAEIIRKEGISENCPRKIVRTAEKIIGLAADGKDS